MEAMEYAVGTMHGQGFARLFRSERFAPSAADHDAVKATGRAVVEKGFAELDKALAGKNYIAGSEFSPAPTALFYAQFCAAKRRNAQQPANVSWHFHRMQPLPALQRSYLPE